MKVRTLVVIGCAALASACFGPRSILGERLRSEHVTWIFETAPHTGKWVDSLESDDAWVDAFEDNTGNLVLIARSPDLSRNVYVTFSDWMAAERDLPGGTVRGDHFEWFTETNGRGYTILAPPLGPVRYTLGFPASGALTVGIYFFDPYQDPLTAGSFGPRLEGTLRLVR